MFFPTISFTFHDILLINKNEKNCGSQLKNMKCSLLELAFCSIFYLLSAHRHIFKLLSVAAKSFVDEQREGEQSSFHCDKWKIVFLLKREAENILGRNSNDKFVEIFIVNFHVFHL